MKRLVNKIKLGKAFAKDKVERLTKKVLAGALAVMISASCVYAMIPTVWASGSLAVLGTNAALGSPILNNNFTIDNWNKWEMIVWGVFLSNFCQPLIDDYNSAFHTGAGGSDGAGYSALCFGSGNDISNNEVIQDLCDYAVTQQSVNEQIYVAYTPLGSDGKLGESPMPNDGTLSMDEASGIVRPATFRDLWFVSSGTLSSLGEKEVGNTYLDNFIQTNSQNFSSSEWSKSNYSLLLLPQGGEVPTFYVLRNGTYIPVLDYTDSWDLQMMSLMTNSIRSSEYNDAFESGFTDAWDNDMSIYLDTFANITLSDGTMVFPAACNQNITTSKKINLLNSWIMNGYSSSTSNSQLISSARQRDDLPWYEKIGDFIGGNGIKSGLPAISDSKLADGTVLMYYDLDTIATQSLLYPTSSSAATSNYGEAALKLFNQHMDDDTHDLTLKIEATGDVYNSRWSKVFNNDQDFADIMGTMSFAASVLPNVFNSANTSEILTDLVTQDGNSVSLISENPILIANQIEIGEKTNDANIIRQMMNFLYQSYSSGSVNTRNGVLSRDKVESLFSGSSGVSEVGDKIAEDDSIWDAFVANNSDFEQSKLPSGTWKERFDWAGTNTFSTESSRLILVYPVSDTMRKVANVLALRDGTEFSTYSTIIYMTYLDWYGVINSATITTGQEKTSELNTQLFPESSDVLNIDIGNITTVKSEDQLESEVLNMGYLMLSPDADGREYRKEILANTLADWIYDQYLRVVYGEVSDSYSMATKGDSGFLSIDTYAENWFTSWFIESYAMIATWMIMICVILIIILGLLKSRSMSWYVFSVFTVINVLLLVPSSGDIMPLIASNTVNKVFNNKMTYWAISEGVSNARIEDDALTSEDYSNLGDEEAQSLLSLINTLSVVQTDSSLMVRKDISNKVNQRTEGVYTQIQELQSARWLLPMVMRQFTASEEQDIYNYVYVPLNDQNNDMSNMYWYFNPANLTNQSSYQAKQGNDGVYVQDKNAYKQTFLSNFPDYKTFEFEGGMDYRSYSYSLHDGDETGNFHTYYYGLPVACRLDSRQTVFGSTGENYENVDSFEQYIAQAIVSHGSNSNWNTTENGLDEATVNYTRLDLSTMNSFYSYLWTSENPVFYFFMAVKDSFLVENESVGSLIGKLQGEYRDSPDGEEVRYNFMYASDESDPDNPIAYGYIRDVVDLQHLFTNVIPYLYQIQLTAGGFDGESGILTTTNEHGNVVPLVVSDANQWYDGELQSWFYRSNWATKIMENPEYSQPTKVWDADGNEYTVNNPLLWECYPENRPMVFSEAQMHSLGLTLEDLNIVELKCLEVNEQIVDRWTLLINYAGQEGLTTEVLFRQMAWEAAFAFNEEFSSSVGINTIYTLYPQAVDLRNISFDSIMKMMMINVSKDTSYIYGDTMKTLIETTDIMTAALLLICAYLCSFIIPLVRNLLMAMIFYLGFFSIIKALFTDARYKAKIACGEIVTNAIFLFATLAYYFLFAGLIAITSFDDVLTTSTVQLTSGNPVWTLIAVIVISLLYLYAMYRQICFCFKHYRDMGFEMYASLARYIGDGIQNTIGTLGDKIMHREPTRQSSQNTIENNSTTVNNNNKTTENKAASVSTSGSTTTISNSDGTTTVVTHNGTATDGKGSEELNNSPNNGKVEDNKGSSVDIDNEINKGKEIERKEEAQKESTTTNTTTTTTTTTNK